MTSRRLCIAAAMGTILACTTDTAVGPRDIASLAVFPDSTTIAVGDTVRLLAVATDSRGVSYIGLATQWSSSAPAVAAVSGGGAAAGLSVGTSVLTATSQGLTATAQVTVTPQPLMLTSIDTITFTGFAHGPTPGPQTVIVTNGNPGVLDGISSTITYVPPASAWLTVTHSQTVAPDTLTLTDTTTAFATGVHLARVLVHARRASNTPDTVVVRLVLAAGTPSQATADSGDGQSATVNSSVAVKPTVLVRDQFGNPIPGVPVTFAVASGQGSVTGATDTTDAAGRARVGSWRLGTAVGVDTLIATATPLPGAPVRFTATATPGAPVQVVKTGGDGQTAIVNTAVTTAPSVNIQDQFGNVIPGATVTFAPAAGSGSVTGGITTTDASGSATVGSWTLGTVAGTDTLVATAGTGSARFTATAAVAAAAQIQSHAGNGQSATVNTAVATAPQVKVTDQFGNAVAGIVVTFTIVSGGGGITGPVATTDGAGLAAVGSWTLGTVAKIDTLQAAAGSLAGSPVTFTATAAAGPPASFAKSLGDGQSVPVNTALPIPPTVLVQDGFNNPVPGVQVTFSVTPGNGSLTAAVNTTGAAGTAAVGSWTLSSTAKIDTLTASVTGFPSVRFTATATAGSASAITRISAASRTDSIGASFVDSVKVTDGAGNAVSGVSVSFAAGGSGSFSPTVVATNAAGIAASTRTLGTTAGTATDTTKATGLTGSPLLFTATTTSGQATTLGSTGDSQTDTVGHTLALAYTALATDRVGNPVSGVNVTFAITAGGGALDGGAGPVTKATSVAGQASVIRTLGPTVGTQTVGATAGTLTGSPHSFSAIATNDKPMQLAANAATNNQSATAGTAVPTPPAVFARDQFGNPVAGVIVTFGSTPRSGSVTKPVDTTDAAGVAAVGSWTLGSTAGPDTLTATSAPALTGSPVLIFATGISGTATTMALDGGNNQTDTVRATLGTPYAVRVTDAASNPVQGVTVSWAVTKGGGSITPGTSQTDASGIARATRVLGDSAGTQTATASVGGLSGSPVTFTATANPGNPAQLAKQAGDGQSATVNTTVAVAPTASVKDAYGNAVSGVNVTFTITAGSGAINGGAGPVTVATGAGGTAALGSWKLGTIAGGNTVSTSSGTLTPVVFSATGTADVPAAIAKTAGDAQTATVGTAVSTNPQVRVTDQFGNGVPSATVTFTVTSGGGQVNGAGSATPSTNGSGFASVTWTLGTTVGANGMSATVAALAPAAFTATGTAAAPQTLALLGGNNQTDTIGTTLPTAYSVSVTDQYGNAVGGVNVTFTITAGGGAIDAVAGPVTKASGSNGQTSVIRTLGSTAGTQTVQASASVPSGSPQTFTATATPGHATTIAANSATLLSGAVNAAVSPAPSVKVTDRAGNGVSGVSVTFAPASVASGSVTGGSPTTGATGIATVGAWTLDQTVGNDTVFAASSGLTNSPVRFVATSSPAAVSLTGSTLTASNSPITACNASCSTGGGTASTITVTVKDQFNNVIAGKTVTPSCAVGTSCTFNPTSGVTDQFGVFNSTLTSTKAEAKTIQAAVTGSGTLTQTAAVTVNPDLTQLLSASIVTGTSPITASSGGSLSTVTVTVRDQFANGVSGRTVTIAVSPVTGNTVTQPAATTNASGQTSGTFYSTKAESKTVTASVNGTGGGAIVDNAIVTVNAAAASQLVMVTQPAGATSNVVFTTQPQVRLQDAFGNNVLQNGTSVTASKNAGTGTLSGTTGASTDANGIASWSTLTITGLLTGYGNHSLTFASGGLTSTTSTTFTVLVSHSYNIQSGIYTPTCNGCHSLTYASTVNQPSSCASTPTLITPNNTSASHVWRKVNGTQLCGGVMPPSGVNATFSDIIARWINQGAPNN